MAQPECQSTSTKYQYNQIHELDRALGTMRKFGIPEAADAYQQLFRLRGKLMAQIGFKLPRPLSLLAKLVGLSPGILKVWHDAEAGWMAEARERPGAPPIYRAVSDEVAMAILKKEVTPELEKELLTPDDYLGE